jgi:hypothetical protein
MYSVPKSECAYVRVTYRRTPAARRRSLSLCRHRRPQATEISLFGIVSLIVRSINHQIVSNNSSSPAGRSFETTHYACDRTYNRKSKDHPSVFNPPLLSLKHIIG